MQHDVFRDHLGDVALFQKRVGERLQPCDQIVRRVAPIEGLFEILAAIVRVVLRIHAVRDDEDLHILEEGVVRAVRVPVIAVHLIERFSNFQPTPLQFDLHQR